MSAVIRASVDLRQVRVPILPLTLVRLMQRWSLTPIFDEYRRYAGTKVHLLDQQFIEFFRPTPEHWAKERVTKRHR